MRYDAFLSYSQAADGRLAPAVQLALHRLARPWYRRRALYVFRDKANLAASPHLWPSIVEALAQSKALILFASPKAAASPWVEREIALWKTFEPRRPIFLAVTDGKIEWDLERQAFTDDSTAVPPVLRDAFGTEPPKWADFRAVRNAEDLSLKNDTFADAAAELAAGLRGVTKDLLIGEDIRQHARVRRVIGWTSAVLLALLIATVMQFRSARKQTVIATQQTERARESRANEIATNLGADVPADVALLTAVEASRLAETPTTVRTLLQTIQKHHAGAQQLLHPSENQINVGDVAMSGGGKVAVRTYERSIELWKPPAFQRQTIPDANAMAVAFAGGRLFFITSGGSTLQELGRAARALPIDCSMAQVDAADAAFAADASAFVLVAPCAAAQTEFVCRIGATISCTSNAFEMDYPAVAMTPDGHTVAIAGYRDDTNKASVWVHGTDVPRHGKPVVFNDDVVTMTAPDANRILVLLGSGKKVAIDVATMKTSDAGSIELPKRHTSMRLAGAATPMMDRVVTTDALEGVGLPDVDATLTVVTGSEQLVRSLAGTVAVSPSGQAAMAQCASGHCVIRFGATILDAKVSSIAAATFSSDGSLFAAASMNRVMLWRVAGGALLFDTSIDASAIRLRIASQAHVVLAEMEGRAVTIAFDGKVTPMGNLDAIDIDDHGVMFSEHLGALERRDLAGRETKQGGEDAEVLALSDDGAVLVTGVFGRGEGLEPHITIRPLAPNATPPPPIRVGGYSHVAAGRRFVAVETDGGLLLYDRATGAAASAPFAIGEVERLDFAGDFLTASYGNGRGMIAITTRAADLQRLACTIANRDLSPGEWALRFAPFPYERVCSSILGDP